MSVARYKDEESELFKVGMYLRLSQEDKIKKESESNSIDNQRKIIKNYIDKSDDLVLIEEYSDDGFTGTDFNRPSFQRMLDDIKNKKIDTIIVKDLSRFGRNYIEVGKFLEDTFPTLRVRFISIIDSIDSFKDPESTNSILVNFKNLINDEYARDISKKVKSSLNARQKKGDYIASSIPFGYKRDKNNKYHLVIDEEAANIVKLIFEMALDHSVSEIADYLNERKILTPSQYKKKKGLSYKSSIVNEHNVDDLKYNLNIITSILRNEVYTGATIQNKCNKISYKIKKNIRTEKEKWIIVENTHEALVSKKDFEYIQEKYYTKIIKVRNNKDYALFSGFLICDKCNRGFHFIKGKPRKDGSRLNYYICGSNNLNKDSCTSHIIHEDKLKEIIIKAINKHIRLVTKLNDEINIISNNKRTSIKIEVLANKKRELEESINKNMKLKQELYTDWKDNIITFDDYREYSKSYSNEIEKNREVLKTIDDELEKMENIPDYHQNLINTFCNQEFIINLDRDILFNFIDHIIIYENNRVEIVFKYNDIYKNLSKFIKDNKDYLN